MFNVLPARQGPHWDIAIMMKEVEILGTAVGIEAFVQSFIDRLEEKRL